MPKADPETGNPTPGDQKQAPSMTAIATIWNPDGNVSNQILTFFNDSDAQLGFELVDAQGPRKVSTTTATDGTKGVIRNPSQLAVIHYLQLVRVYGINDSTSGIVLISPGFQPASLATGAKSGSLAACCNEVDQLAWLYYINASNSIIEYDLANSQSNPLSLSNISPNSYLGAAFDPKSGRRYLVCQGSNNTLYRCEGSLQDPITTSAVAKTPLAVVANPTRTQLHIYYRANTSDPNDQHVRRISWSPNADPPYSDPKSLADFPNMDQFTMLSAVAASDKVHLFYVYQVDDNTRALTHVQDNWASLSAKPPSDEGGGAPHNPGRVH
ncbi:hypothetical protein CONLIGDRAFT_163106 [Coniochaeta ligniaria NRRL 30616]|uniref:Fucose-specific lectin n=1 Tax=Coniochaeta ligniaria NRRL 30616 TaxID=1408157 RepID=A0A1J7JID2_9PEZI|nr:hypothetical protein CONLIGDRAFT_163106 [Coniochaeta ligniaria NRRL 30616]